MYSVAIGTGADAETRPHAVAIGELSKSISIGATALGYRAFASVENSLAVTQTPDKFYFNSNVDDNGVNSKSLAAYLGERAPAAISVETDIGTETVEKLNELLEEVEKLPTEGTVTVAKAISAIAKAIVTLKSKQEDTDAKVSAANTALEEVA